MFIELHKRDGSPILINTDQVSAIYLPEYSKPNYQTTIRTVTGLWEVSESYDEIKEKILDGERLITYESI